MARTPLGKAPWHTAVLWYGIRLTRSHYSREARRVLSQTLANIDVTERGPDSFEDRIGQAASKRDLLSWRATRDATTLTIQLGGVLTLDCAAALW